MIRGGKSSTGFGSAAPAPGRASATTAGDNHSGIEVTIIEARNVPVVGWRRTGTSTTGPVLAMLSLILSGCVNSEPSAPSLAAQASTLSDTPSSSLALPTVPSAKATPVAGAAPQPPGLDAIRTAGTSFHDIMSRPYSQTKQQILASIAVEDDMGVNPDGSFRLPPSIHIPIIDISPGHSALATGQTPDERDAVDISVPW